MDGGSVKRCRLNGVNVVKDDGVSKQYVLSKMMGWVYIIKIFSIRYADENVIPRQPFLLGISTYSQQRKQSMIHLQWKTYGSGGAIEKV